MSEYWVIQGMAGELLCGPQEKWGSRKMTGDVAENLTDKTTSLIPEINLCLLIHKV